MNSIDACTTNISLDVPFTYQSRSCSCGLACLAMVFRYYALQVDVPTLEKHPLVKLSMLKAYGIGPGRLGRIASSYGYKVSIIDPEEKDVGKTFVKTGGNWIPRLPNKQDIIALLARGVPAIACIPNKEKAFYNANNSGSHWIVVRATENGDFLFHDPAPWRQNNTRCKPGYWDTWSCSLIIIEKNIA